MLPDVEALCQATVPVLVPWRTDNGAREANWKMVEDAMWAPWRRLYVGEPGPGPFNRSEALNEAYASAQLEGAGDVVVVADADSMVPPLQLLAAILLARGTRRLVVAHDRWVNVEEHERDEFLTTGHVDEKRVAERHGFRARRLVYKQTVSSMLVVPTHLWHAVGGFDDRFVGWGFEDRAFHRACTIMAGGYERVDGPCYHLAHDRPAADTNRQRDRGFRANRDLWFEYRRASTIDQLGRARWPAGRP